MGRPVRLESLHIPGEREKKKKKKNKTLDERETTGHITIRING